MSDTQTIPYRQSRDIWERFQQKYPDLAKSVDERQFGAVLNEVQPGFGDPLTDTGLSNYSNRYSYFMSNNPVMKGASKITGPLGRIIGGSLGNVVSAVDALANPDKLINPADTSWADTGEQIGAESPRTIAQIGTMAIPYVGPFAAAADMMSQTYETTANRDATLTSGVVGLAMPGLGKASRVTSGSPVARALTRAKVPDWVIRTGEEVTMNSGVAMTQAGVSQIPSLMSGELTSPDDLPGGWAQQLRTSVVGMAYSLPYIMFGRSAVSLPGRSAVQEMNNTGKEDGKASVGEYPLTTVPGRSGFDVVKSDLSGEPKYPGEMQFPLEVQYPLSRRVRGQSDVIDAAYRDLGPVKGLEGRLMLGVSDEMPLSPRSRRQGRLPEPDVVDAEYVDLGKFESVKLLQDSAMGKTNEEVNVRNNALLALDEVRLQEKSNAAAKVVDVVSESASLALAGANAGRPIAGAMPGVEPSVAPGGGKIAAEAQKQAMPVAALQVRLPDPTVSTDTDLIKTMQDAKRTKSDAAKRVVAVESDPSVAKEDKLAVAQERENNAMLASKRAEAMAKAKQAAEAKRAEKELQSVEKTTKAGQRKPAKDVANPLSEEHFNGAVAAVNSPEFVASLQERYVGFFSESGQGKKRDYTTLTMRVLNKLSYDEIADALDKPVKDLLLADVLPFAMRKVREAVAHENRFAAADQAKRGTVSSGGELQSDEGSVTTDATAQESVRRYEEQQRNPNLFAAREQANQLTDALWTRFKSAIDKTIEGVKYKPKRQRLEILAEAFDELGLPEFDVERFVRTGVVQITAGEDYINTVIEFYNQRGVKASRDTVLADINGKTGQPGLLEMLMKNVRGEDKAKYAQVAEQLRGLVRTNDSNVTSDANIEAFVTLREIFERAGYSPAEARAWARIGTNLYGMFHKTPEAIHRFGQLVSKNTLGLSIVDGMTHQRWTLLNPMMLKTAPEILAYLGHELHHTFVRGLLDKGASSEMRNAYVNAINSIHGLSREQWSGLVDELLAAQPHYAREGKVESRKKILMDMYESSRKNGDLESGEELLAEIWQAAVYKNVMAKPSLVDNILSVLPAGVRGYVAKIAHAIGDITQTVLSLSGSKDAKVRTVLKQASKYAEKILKTQDELAAYDEMLHGMLNSADAETYQRYMSTGTTTTFWDSAMYDRHLARYSERGSIWSKSGLDKTVDPAVAEKVNQIMKQYEGENMNPYFKYLVPFNWLAERYPALRPVRSLLANYRADAQVIVDKLTSVLSWDGEKVDTTYKFVHQFMDDKKLHDILFRQVEQKKLFSDAELATEGLTDKQRLFIKNTHDMFAKARETLFQFEYDSTVSGFARVLRSQGMTIDDANNTARAFLDALKSNSDPAPFAEKLGSFYEKNLENARELLGAYTKMTSAVEANPWYIPLTRTGRWQIRYKTADGETYRGQGFDDIKLAKEEVSRLVAAGFEPELQDTGKSDNRYDRFDPVFLASLVELEQTRVRSLKATMSPEEFAANMQEASAMQKALYDMTTRGFAKHFKHRQLVAGYRETNPVANAVDYIGNMAYHLSRKKARNELAMALTDDQLRQTPALYDKAKLHGEYVLNPAHKDYANLKQGLSFWALGYNLSSMMLNASQPAMVAVPELIRQGAGLAEGYKLIVQAYKMNVDAALGKVSDPVMEKFLERAKVEGRLTSKKTYDYIDLNEEARLLNLRKSLMEKATSRENLLGNGLYQVMYGSRVLNNAVESMNQSATMRAAYLLGKRKGLSGEQLYQFMTTTNDLVNYTGSKANRIGLFEHVGTGGLHGALGVMMVMRSFSANALAQMVVGVREAVSRQNGLTGKERIAAQRGVALLIGHALLAGGVLGGVPFASDINDVVRSLTGQDARELTRKSVDSLVGEDAELGNLFSDVVLRGMFSNGLTGVDVSSRVGLGRTLGIDSRTGTYSVLDLAGVPGSIVTRMMDSLGMLGNGQPWQAAEQLLPTGFKNASRVLREGTSMRNRDGDVIMRMGMWDNVKRFLGVQPKATADYYEAQTVFRSDLKRRQADEDQFIHSVADMVRAGQYAGASQLLRQRATENPQYDYNAAMRKAVELAQSSERPKQVLNAPKAQREMNVEYSRLYPGVQGPSATPLAEAQAAAQSQAAAGLKPSVSQLKSAAILQRLIESGVSPEQAQLLADRLTSRPR